MTALLRTIIIDSDEDSRVSLEHILEGTPSVIVGEFRNIAEALRTAPAYRPDVVIVEIPLEKGSNGDSASSTIEHLARVLPDAAILVTGPTQSAHLVIQVMRAGALDFVARPVKPDDLRGALEKVTHAINFFGAGSSHAKSGSEARWRNQPQHGVSRNEEANQLCPGTRGATRNARYGRAI